MNVLSCVGPFDAAVTVYVLWFASVSVCVSLNQDGNDAALNVPSYVTAVVTEPPLAGIFNVDGFADNANDIPACSIGNAIDAPNSSLK